MIRLRARWVYSGDSSPIEHAVVAIENGMIQSVDARGGAADEDLGDVALIPALVNAHTHLEFSQIAKPLEPLGSFPDWIRQVIAFRRNANTNPIQAIRQGLTESRSHGTDQLAEIATSDWPLTAPELAQGASGVGVRPFREVLGLQPEALESTRKMAGEFLDAARRQGISAGLSPHAPFSLHHELFEQTCVLCETHQVPATMHLAESPAEMELLKTRSGPLVEMLQAFGVWREDAVRARRPLEFLKRLARLPRALIVHGAFLDAEERRFLAEQKNLWLIYCPRTHAAMQPGAHPWRTMLNQGVRIALGTDSRASNPNLSVWEELRFLHTQARDLPASRLLPLGTIHGAQALAPIERCDGRPFGIVPGAPARLCAVRLTPAGVTNPEVHLFDGDPARVMSERDWQTGSEKNRPR